MLATITIAMQLMELGLKIVPTIMDAVNTEMELSGSANGPTKEQQEAIDAGLRAAHKALQEATPS